MKRAKILEIVPALTFGGVEQFLYNYLSHINLNQFEVHILTQEPRDKKAEKRFLTLGIKIYSIPTKKKNIVKHFKKTKELFRREQYDIVHCHLSAKSFWMLALAKYSGIKTRIYHAHEARMDKGLKRLKWKIYASLSKYYATDLFACGREAAEFCFGNADYLYVPNIIDFKKFEFNNKDRLEIRNKYEISDEDIVIGNMARLAPEKNHKFLIDIFSKIGDKRYKLLLVGSGPLECEIKEQVAKLGIKESVIFLEATNTPEKYYSAMDVFLLTSFSEGFGMAILEAQANGLPCIVSDSVSDDVIYSKSFIKLSLSEEDRVWVNEIRKNSNKRTTQVFRKMQDFNVAKNEDKLGKIYLQILRGSENSVKTDRKRSTVYGEK